METEQIQDGCSALLRYNPNTKSIFLLDREKWSLIVFSFSSFQLQEDKIQGTVSVHFKLLLLPHDRSLITIFSWSSFLFLWFFIIFLLQIFHLCFHHQFACFSLLSFPTLKKKFDGLRLQVLALSLWFIYSWGYFAIKLRKFGCKRKSLFSEYS